MKKIKSIFFPLAFSVLLLALTACGTERNEAEITDRPEFSPVEWSRNATIYEVNVRQFSEEGTFQRVEEHLPRLRELGIDIIWLMPIHPIGVVERKGTLGSYYSVKDYFDVNPEFGTKDDFRSLVETAHDLGMRVILDWVANHTAWDNPLTITNPEFFARDAEGNFMPPYDTDWSDVIQLDFNNPEVHDYMISALRYWVEEFNIDGYRADVAYLVPTEFWIRARRELDSIRPVFMLAEAFSPELHPAFDMGYWWEMHHLWNRIARGEGELSEIDSLIENFRRDFPEDTFMMNFITNHDENSWAGTEFERLGDGVRAFAVKMSLMEGMPLIYNGQETGFNRRLEFFEKDPIVWDFDSPFVDFYSTLFHLKREHPALRNGIEGGPMIRLRTSEDDAIYAFTRSRDDSHVIVVLNFTDQEQTFALTGEIPGGSYLELFSQEDGLVTDLTLPAWGYRVFVSTN